MEKLTLETKKSIMNDFFCHFELINLTKKLQLTWEREESPYIIGMLHDLCKIDAYTLVPEEEIVTTQTLTGEDTKVPIVTGYHYEWNWQQLLDGHGEKSCILALRYIQLTDEELMCIRYHMGAFEGERKWNKYSEAVKKYPNVLWTHTADMIASQIKDV